MSRLPVPVVGPNDAAFERLNALTRSLATSSAPVEEHPDYAVLQATVANLYRLATKDLEHILNTFPLINPAARAATLAAFAALDHAAPRR
jgi:hypothetical protein